MAREGRRDEQRRNAEESYASYFESGKQRILAVEEIRDQCQMREEEGIVKRKEDKESSQVGRKHSTLVK